MTFLWMCVVYKQTRWISSLHLKLWSLLPSLFQLLSEAPSRSSMNYCSNYSLFQTFAPQHFNSRQYSHEKNSFIWIRGEKIGRKIETIACWVIQSVTNKNALSVTSHNRPIFIISTTLCQFASSSATRSRDNNCTNLWFPSMIMLS